MSGTTTAKLPSTKPPNLVDHKACGHCNGFGCHEDNPAHICIACQRTGLLPLLPENDHQLLHFSKKSKEIYDKLSALPDQSFSINNPNFKVIVSGSGIAGAAFSLAMQQRGFNVVCYERDTHFDQRAQGYGLTLQQGGAAVHALGVSCAWNNEFYAVTKHNAFSSDGSLVGSYGSLDDSAHTSIDGNLDNGVLSLEETGDSVHVETKKKGFNHAQLHKNDKVFQKRKAPKHNMIITRQDLRQELINKLKPGTIQWGISVIGYTEQQQDVSMNGSTLENGLLTIHLSNGEIIPNVSLLVGCEGLRSTIRRQKLQICKPLNFLHTFVILGISLHNDGIDTPEQPGQSINYAQRTFVNQASDGCTRIYSMQFDAKSIMWQMSFSISSLEEAIALQSTGAQGMLEEARRRCADWTLDYIKPLLMNSHANGLTGYPAFDRDMPSSLELRDGIVISGDQNSVPDQDKDDSAIESQVVSPSLPSDTKSPLRPSECPRQKYSYVTTRQGNKRVTLLGDAMHPCSPFKAQGANQALIDAVYCARAITRLFIRKKDSKVESNIDRNETGQNDQNDQNKKPYISKKKLAKMEKQRQLDLEAAVSAVGETILGEEPRVGSSEKGSSVSTTLDQTPTSLSASGLPPIVLAPISPSLEDLDRILSLFEQEMIKRATPKVYDSRNHIELLHSAATLAVGNMPRAYVAKMASPNAVEE